jgi:nitrite reductase (NO-forming)
MSFKIQDLVYIINFIKKSHLLVLPSIIFFTVVMVVTSLSIANTNLIDSDVFAQISNQTVLPANTNSSNWNSLISTSLSTDNISKINNNTDTTNFTTLANESSTNTNGSNKQITLITEDVEIDIAPGERVKAWTFNGTVPGPTIRLAEGENLTIKYINKSPIPHTIHFHGNHDDDDDDGAFISSTT